MKIGPIVTVAGLVILLLVPIQVHGLNEKETADWFEKLAKWWDTKLISKTEVDNAIDYMVGHGFADRSAPNLKSYLSIKESVKELSADTTRINSELDIVYGNFTIKVIKCHPMSGGKYLDVGGQITNNGSVIHNPELSYQGIDKNGAIITFELGYSGVIQPGQTILVDRIIMDDSAIDSCRITVNQAN